MIPKQEQGNEHNQKNNPHGTQRNLSPQHAKEAYNYVKNRELAFWPEVFLSARNKKVVKYFPSKSKKEIGNLVIDVDAIENADTIAISRVDGNHRLHYADGKSRKYPAGSRRARQNTLARIAPRRGVRKEIDEIFFLLIHHPILPGSAAWQSALPVCGSSPPFYLEYY